MNPLMKNLISDGGILTSAVSRFVCKERIDFERDTVVFEGSLLIGTRRDVVHRKYLLIEHLAYGALIRRRAPT